MRVSRPHLKTKQNKKCWERVCWETGSRNGNRRGWKTCNKTGLRGRPPSPPPPPTRASIPTSHHPAGVKRQGRVKHVFEEGGALIWRSRRLTNSGFLPNGLLLDLRQLHRFCHISHMDLPDIKRQSLKSTDVSATVDGFPFHAEHRGPGTLV